LAGLRPGLRWGSLQRSPDSLAGLKVEHAKREVVVEGSGGNGRGKGGEGRKGTPNFENVAAPLDPTY